MSDRGLILHLQSMCYITEEGEQAARKFNYKGGDLSLSYKYLWSPFSDRIVEIIPRTWAPNAITLIGCLINAFATIILISQGQFTQPAPSWSLFLYGFAVFTYQTLDNVDGKQARRLHNSSPLGMIMDHGCDALELLFLTLGFSRILCIGDFELILWVFTVGVSFSFYISAWCQYYSNGVMVLGRINAVDDGIPIIWLCAFYSAIFGQNLWRTPLIIFSKQYLLNTVIAISMVFAGIIQVYSIIKRAGERFTKDLARAFFDLLHLPLITVAVYSINMHSNLCKDHFPAIIAGVGFTMGRTIIYTLVCTVTKMRFNQFHPSLLIFSLAYPAYIYFGQSYFSSSLVVYSIAFLIIIEYFIFIASILRQLSQALRIRIFHVFPPKRQ